MKRDALKNKDNDSQHIAGIYNYCDRWCERCPFTARCLNFEMSEEKFGDLENGDISNEVFWQKLSETLQETMAMLKEMAEEKGIDLDALDVEAGAEFRDRREDTPVVHLITHMARSYINTVEEWFDENIYILEDNPDELATLSLSDSYRSHHRADTVSLIDSVEVIRWYQHQIYVKLQRALHSARNEEFEILNGFPKDSDGSTKVALIGVDRSVSAWGKIIKFFPDQEENIISIIVHLERLRRRTENEFPEARTFIRPGFDEIDKEKMP